jgi:hypothetical protein
VVEEVEERPMFGSEDLACWSQREGEGPVILLAPVVMPIRMDGVAAQVEVFTVA